ncbi:vesicular amine transporter [Schistosoma japonicum]|nr:vesicular amine transporter [Schistosoma japonicum]
MKLFLMQLFCETIKNGTILKKSHQSTLSSVNGNRTRLVNLPLELSKIRSDQHGSVYVCEAGLNSTVPHKKATEEVMLEVTMYPNINVSNSVIYTDLGVEEKFNIFVTGYPTPTLKCNDLPVGDGHLLSEKIQGGIWVYPVVFSQITPQHLHEYLCIANNSLGSVIRKLEITVAPAPPIILSSNSSEYADYYLLHWKTTSRAPLKNVTVTVSEVSTNTEPGSGPMVPRSPTLFERVFNLEDDKIDSTSTLIKNVTMQSSNPTNSKQIWHHLTNLSSDTRHDISLSVCNAYACTKSSSLKGRSGGSNNINPVLLQRSPKDILSFDDETNTMSNGNYAKLTSHQALTVFIISSHVIKSTFNDTDHDVDDDDDDDDDDDNHNN